MTITRVKLKSSDCIFEQDELEFVLEIKNGGKIYYSVKLKEEIAEWLSLNRIRYKFVNQSFEVFSLLPPFFIDFYNETDAIFFKMRW